MSQPSQNTGPAPQPTSPSNGSAGDKPNYLAAGHGPPILTRDIVRHSQAVSS